MWIDDENVLHTVALPIPTDVMSVEFRRGLDSLIASGRERLRDVVQEVQTRLLEMDWSLMNRSEFYVETSPQRELLSCRGETSDDVSDAIESVHERWRLDVALALEDYIA